MIIVSSYTNNLGHWEVVVAQLVERSLSIPFYLIEYVDRISTWGWCGIAWKRMLGWVQVIEVSLRRFGSRGGKLFNLI